MEKYCKKCNELKQVSEFRPRKDRTSGCYNYCKQCRNDKARASRFSITIEELKTYMSVNKCECCNKELQDDKDKYIDHCHITNTIRGVLCHKCNTGIGMLGDDIKGLLNAIKYLS